jgi:hypothetical protein
VEVGDEMTDNDERPITYYKNTLESCYGFCTDKITYGNIGSYYAAEVNQYKNIGNWSSSKYSQLLHYFTQRKMYLYKYYRQIMYRRLHLNSKTKTKTKTKTNLKGRIHRIWM